MVAVFRVHKITDMCMDTRTVTMVQVINTS